MGERRRGGSPVVAWGGSPKPGRVTAGDDFSFAFQIRKPVVRQQARASPISTPKRTTARSPPMSRKDTKALSQKSSEKPSIHGDVFLKYLEDLKSRINADVRGARSSHKSASPPAETRGDKSRHRRLQSDAKGVDRVERQSPVSRLFARMEDLGNAADQSRHRRNASVEMDHSVHVESPLNISDEKTVKRGFHCRSSSSSKLIGEEAKDLAGSGSAASLIAAEEDKEQLMKIVKLSYRSSGSPPVTTSEFYRFGRMLGKGAFGKVSLAVHKLTGLKVAIKSIDKAYMKDEHRRRKVFQEVFTMRRIRNKNVIRLFEVFESSRHFNMVLEYCGGGDLLQFVKTRIRLPESEAVLIFQQILEAVRACHGMNIIHRDVKLDNVLIDSTYRTAKLCDFGVSRMVKPGQRINDQCGTPAYIAPEIIADRGYEGFPVDVWSLGVLLYAMITGTVPFRAKSMPELHKLILRGKFDIPEHVSIAGRSLLEGMLTLVPQQRMTLDQVARHPWVLGAHDDLEMYESTMPRFLGAEPGLLDKSGTIGIHHSDQTVLSQLERLGFVADNVVHSLCYREINHATATYELLELNAENSL